MISDPRHDFLSLGSEPDAEEVRRYAALDLAVSLLRADPGGVSRDGTVRCAEVFERYLRDGTVPR